MMSQTSFTAADVQRCFATGTLLTVDGGNHLRRAPCPDELPTTAFAATS